MAELWRPIVGHPDYKISNLGKIISYKKKTAKLLKILPNKYGFMNISLFTDGVKYRFLVHELVADHFLNRKGIPVRLFKDRFNPSVDNIALGPLNNFRLDGTSSLRGVALTRVSNKKKWQVVHQVAGVFKHLGYFDNEVEASTTYLKSKTFQTE